MYTTNALQKYQTKLEELVEITLPLAKIITCLESMQSTLADAFLLWLAALATIKDVLDSDTSDIDDNVASEVKSILNYRYHEYFQDGPTDLHMAAFFLNPYL